MVFVPYLLQMAERKKMLRVKVVCLEILYHPSNFLPSLKKHSVYTRSPRLKRHNFTHKGTSPTVISRFFSYMASSKENILKLNVVYSVSATVTLFLRNRPRS